MTNNLYIYIIHIIHCTSHNDNGHSPKSHYDHNTASCHSRLIANEGMKKGTIDLKSRMISGCS